MREGVGVVPPKKVRQRSSSRTEAFYGPGELWDRFDAIAKSEGRAKSELLVGILTDWIRSYDAERASQKPQKPKP